MVVIVETMRILVVRSAHTKLCRLFVHHAHKAVETSADVNGDETVDVYDLQLLYETVCNG